MSSISSSTFTKTMSTSMNRRRFSAGVAAVAAAAVTRAAVGAQSADGEFNAALAQPYLTTTALNLRESPSTSAKVILVIPAGAAVTGSDDIQNGFRRVSYQGKLGWAYNQFLQLTNPGSSDPAPITGQAKTAVAANLRTGPTQLHEVILVVPAGAVVESTDRVESGYRMVRYNGKYGYIFNQLLAPVSGNPGGQPSVVGFTTASLNMRETPSTSAKILTIVPAGAEVRMGDQLNNGYRQVTWQGLTGWVLNQYLTTAAPSNKATVTTSLNLREFPSTSAKVLLVMPLGAVVEYTGNKDSGFRQVIYKGTYGWAYEQFLKF